jgi:hypothetical protein
VGEFDVFRKPVSCVRKNDGGYDTNGIWQEGVETPFEIIGDVQSLSEYEMQELPEGRRLDKSFRIYSETSLNPVTSKNPDVVLINGERYEVIATYPHQEHDVIDHYKMIVLKAEQGQ